MFFGKKCRFFLKKIKLKFKTKDPHYKGFFNDVNPLKINDKLEHNSLIAENEKFYKSYIEKNCENYIF